jgi:putative SOS response-associated peptidase YedK
MLIGLVPSWSKEVPDYRSLMRTINCRDDSLLDNKGMWVSMKHRKRCVVIAEGFYEWLNKGGKKVDAPALSRSARIDP